MNEFAIVAEMPQVVFDDDHDIASDYTYCAERHTLIIKAHTGNDIEYRFKNVNAAVLQQATGAYKMYSKHGLNVFIWALKQYGAEVADCEDSQESGLKFHSKEEVDIAMTKKLLEDIQEYINHEA
jgi:hypothetical protein